MSWLKLAVLMAHLNIVHAAVSYSLKCNKNAELENFAVHTSATDCVMYKALNMACGDSKTPSPDPYRMVLRSPLDTYYSNRDSNNYYYGFIKKLIKNAVRNNSDPYLALALIMVEAQPTSPNHIEYLERYGVPPLDGIASLGAMNCTIQNQKVQSESFMTNQSYNEIKSQLDSKVGGPLHLVKSVKQGEPLDLKNAKVSIVSLKAANVVPEDGVILARDLQVQTPVGSGRRQQVNLFDAKDATAEVLTVQVNHVQLAAPAIYEIQDNKFANAESCKERCCINVLIPKNFMVDTSHNSKSGMISAFWNNLLFIELKIAMGYKFIDTMMTKNASLPFVKQKTSSAERFAAAVQGYNGYGILGGSEKVNNPCLNGVNMKNTPLYGAGVSELMLNSLMANSEMRDLVQAAEAEYGRSATKSFLCDSLGAGTHQVDALVFAKMQARYLAGRSGCGGHTFTYKTTDAFTHQAAPAINPDTEQ